MRLGIIFVVCLLVLGCKVDAKLESKPTATPDPNIVVLPGPLTVEYAWHWANDDGTDGAETGQYQFKTMDGVTYVIQFCDPIPIFQKGQSLSSIKFSKANSDIRKCLSFISAQQ